MLLYKREDSSCVQNVYTYILLLLLLLLLRIIKNTDYISYQSIYSSRKLKKMLRKLRSIKRKQVLLTVWETWGKNKGGKNENKMASVGVEVSVLP